MDDYGIGYSSMQTLSRSPFTELKIDRLFVSEAAARPARRAMLTSAIEMAHRLGIASVAEGLRRLPTGPCSASWAATRPRATCWHAPCRPRSWCLGARQPARLRGLVVRR